MKKISLTILLIIFTLFCSFASVSYSSTYTNSGEYMFSMDGNDSNTDESNIETEIEKWFLTEKQTDRDIFLDFYSKIDAPATSSNSMTITYGDDNLSGTWSTLIPIKFYSVKASDEFAFYWIDGGALSGSWSTEDLLTPNGQNIPEISHISSWNPLAAGGSSPPSIPEPATMLLFGFGLLGVAGVCRRKK